MSRICFVLLDLTALIETGLDRRKYQALVGSAPVKSLRHCALLLLETLDRHFPTRTAPAPMQCQHFEENYAAATRTLARVGIEALPGSAGYADHRSRWEPLLRRVGPALGYAIDEMEVQRGTPTTLT